MIKNIPHSVQARLNMALRWDAYARKTKLSLPSFPEVMESIRENLAGIVD